MLQALARAAFSQRQIVVLDDPFSGLDGDTEDQVVSNLFSAQGLFKGKEKTVIILSNASEFSQQKLGLSHEMDIN